MWRLLRQNKPGPLNSLGHVLALTLLTSLGHQHDLHGSLQTEAQLEGVQNREGLP